MWNRPTINQHAGSKVHPDQPLFIDQVQLDTSIINLAINARYAIPGGVSLVFRCDNQHLGTTRASPHDLVAGDYVAIADEAVYLRTASAGSQQVCIKLDEWS